MYLPFLRGKQFELIALRELSELLSQNHSKISPIIEPVRGNNSTIRSTLNSFAENEINFNIILNPAIGDLVNSPNSILQIITESVPEYSNFQICIYISDTTSLLQISRILEQIEFEFKGLSLIHISPHNNLEFLSNLSGIHEIKYNLIDLRKTSRRYYRNFPKETRVSLDDYFRILTKNSAYSNIPDEPYTEEHLFYLEEGYVGFSDYLTIGEPYAESGFLPYAVVIHLTYPTEDNRLRIRHFVSDSNEDSSDVAGKFSEALEKLIRWVNETNIDSIAIREFKNFYNRGHFPGLGVIKKLSVMHHIELVLGLI